MTSTDTTNETWPLSADEIHRRYAGYVRFIAHRLRSRLSSAACFEDLVADGNVGLLEAAQRFDPSLGVKFTTFATRRIRGEMLTGVRKMTWRSSGDVGETVTARSLAIPDRLDTSAFDEADANFKASRARLMRVLLVDDVMLPSTRTSAFEAPDTLSNRPERPLELDEEKAEVVRERERVARAVERLEDHEAELIDALLNRGLTQADLARRHGVARSTIKRRVDAIVRRIQELLDESSRATG